MEQNLRWYRLGSIGRWVVKFWKGPTTKSGTNLSLIKEKPQSIFWMSKDERGQMREHLQSPSYKWNRICKTSLVIFLRQSPFLNHLHMLNVSQSDRLNSDRSAKAFWVTMSNSLQFNGMELNRSSLNCRWSSTKPIWKILTERECYRSHSCSKCSCTIV